MKIKIKDTYRNVSTLDRKLKSLEEMADRMEFNIDDDEIYIELCTILTDADIENKKRIPCSHWMKLFEIVEWRIKMHNRI